MTSSFIRFLRRHAWLMSDVSLEEVSLEAFHSLGFLQIIDDGVAAISDSTDERSDELRMY